MTAHLTPSLRSDVTPALLQDGARVAVFRALFLGDLLCAIPAVRALKHANPAMRLTLISLPWAVGFAARFSHYFDDFLAVPPTRELHGAPEENGAVARALEACRARRFDVALQMHGSGPQSNALVLAMGARYATGFHPGGAVVPAEGVFLPYPDTGSEVGRLLALVAGIGIPPAGEDLEFPVTAEDEVEFDVLARNRDLRPGQYVCVHPGAKLASRRWPPERFGRVADGLAARGYRVVLTGTPGERPMGEVVEAAMSRPAVNLVGETTLGALGVLIDRAALLVANDTGVSHIAAARRTPSVIVACGSEPARWAPADSALHHTLAVEVECRPCAYDECPVGHPCATGVEPATVEAHAHALLDTVEAPP